jgi:hypothetical protein
MRLLELMSLGSIVQLCELHVYTCRIQCLDTVLMLLLWAPSFSTCFTIYGPALWQLHRLHILSGNTSGANYLCWFCFVSYNRWFWLVSVNLPIESEMNICGGKIFYWKNHKYFVPWNRSIPYCLCHPSLSLPPHLSPPQYSIILQLRHSLLY